MRQLFFIFALWLIVVPLCPAQVQADRLDLKGINGRLYVNQAFGNTVTDIGAKIAALYALLPPNGGKVILPPCVGNNCVTVALSSGSIKCWPLTTTISANTPGKPLSIESDQGATCINDARGNGASLLVDWKWNDSSAQHEHGIPVSRGIWWIGASGGTAFEMGSANGGAIHVTFEDGKVQGYSKAWDYSTSPASFFTTISDFGIYNNTIGLNAVVSVEAIKCFNCDWYGNGTSINAAASPLDIYLYGNSMDGDTVANIAISQGIIDIYGLHAENTNLGTNNFINNTGGLVRWHGGFLQVDNTSGTFPSAITCSNTSYVQLEDLIVGGGTTITQLVNAGNSCAVQLIGLQYGSNISDSNIVNGSFAGPLISLPVNGKWQYRNSNNFNLLASTNLSLTANQQIQFGGSFFSGSATQLLAEPNNQIAQFWDSNCSHFRNDAGGGDVATINCSGLGSFNGGLVVGSGSTINKVLNFNGALNSAFTAISAQTSQEQTVTISGASTTNFGVACSPAATLGNVNLSWSAWVSASNTVSIRVSNPTTGSITPSSVNWGCTVNQ